MQSIRDWGLPQMLTNSLTLSRPLSSSGGGFFGGGSAGQDDESASSDSSSVHSATTVASQEPVVAANQDYSLPCPSHVQNDGSSSVHGYAESKKLDTLSRIEVLQIKFFRLLLRLQLSTQDLIVAKVLYRIHLATLISAGNSDLKRINLKSLKARAVAAEEESAGDSELDFPLKILVLGKTGVGKSATINSIFDQTKAATDAFEPATDRLEEVVGTVNGIKITFIDTPGFIPNSANSMRKNRKIMNSIKRYVRRSPPDIVLYFERLDHINLGYGDIPLLKLISEVFGSAIWFNTILVMTHAASALPEGTGGFPVNFDSYANRCTDLLQHYIHQSLSDTKLENPIVLVENHPLCRTNVRGEKILPNGDSWKSQFMLLCVCAKVLVDANSFLRLEKSIELGTSSVSRLPSVPHLLSSLLKQSSVMIANGANNEVEEYFLPDTEEEDEYDKLPPIRILKKAEFEKLSEFHKMEYLDELDYRETLFLKKQLKENLRRRRETRLLEQAVVIDEGHSEEAESSPEAYPLPEIALPPSFDSDYIAHRYQGLVTSDRWLWRPVYDPHGWDHDVGFDGVNLEATVEVEKNVTASFSGQLSKDKQDFNVQSECSAAYSSPGLCTYAVGFDVQSSGKDLICTVHSDAKLKYMKNNVPGCGVSVTSFQNKYYVGAKLEDTVYIRKRMKLVVNAGRMASFDRAAYGGSIEATLIGKDYPVRDDKVSLMLNVLSYDNDMVLGGSFQVEFRPRRALKLSVNANLNSRKMGKLCIKASSSEHIELGFFALFSVVRALCRKRERVI